MLPLAAALCIFVLSSGAHGQSPWGMSFNQTYYIGPDGPWWGVLMPIDYGPTWNLTMLPSLTNETIAINASACNAQSALCPSPIPEMWSFTSADHNADDSITFGNVRSIADMEPTLTQVLSLNGSQRMDQQNSLLFDIDNQLSFGLMIAENVKETFPGGAGYTLDAGFLSLYGGETHTTWTNSSGYQYDSWRMLPNAQSLQLIPSNSYGLQVGSVNLDVPASLVLGGYDISRCLTTPVVSSNSAFELSSIKLGVTTGESAYVKATGSNSTTTNLIESGGDSGTSLLSVYPDPGVPYMFLPNDTCQAIAAYLPVTYSWEFNLYMWNQTDPAYEDIIKSPHYMSFTFSGSDTSSATIYIPFALLNLTLAPPLVDSNVQYFPCSPVDSGVGWRLGRAFLQGAFLSQNWNSSTTWLAQAPGPNYTYATNVDLKSIEPSDTTLTPLSNPQEWSDTWAILQPLNSTSNATGSGPGATATSTSSSTTHLSGGAIAGIVVGISAVLILVAVGLIIFVRRRRRNRQQAAAAGTMVAGHPHNPRTPPHELDRHHGTGTIAEKGEGEGRHVSEADSRPYVSEVDSRGAARHELYAGRPGEI